MRFEDNRGRPIGSLEDWQRAIPPDHWVPECSAYLLAHRWWRAEGLPEPVWRVLDATRVPALVDLKLRRAIVEHKTALPGEGLDSSTDIMVEATNALGQVWIAVEGKAREAFDLDLPGWLASGTSPGSPANRDARARGLCSKLDIDFQEARSKAVGYQLFHRTYAAVRAAEQNRSRHAVMLVHSFVRAQPESESHFDDYREFAELLRLPPSAPQPNATTPEVQVGPVALRLAWVSDNEWATRGANP